MPTYCPYLSINIEALEFEFEKACDFTLSSNQHEIFFCQVDEKCYYLLDLETGEYRTLKFELDYSSDSNQLQIYPIDQNNVLFSIIFLPQRGGNFAVRSIQKMNYEEGKFEFLKNCCVRFERTHDHFSQFCADEKIFLSYGESFRPRLLSIQQHNLNELENVDERGFLPMKNVFGGIEQQNNAVYFHFYGNYFYGFNKSFGNGLLNKIGGLHEIGQIFDKIYKLSRNDESEEVIDLSLESFKEQLSEFIFEKLVVTVDPHWHQNKFFLHIFLKFPTNINKQSNHFFSLDLDTFKWSPISIEFPKSRISFPLKMTVNDYDEMVLIQFSNEGKENKRVAKQIDLYKVSLRNPEKLKFWCQSMFNKRYGDSLKVKNNNILKVFLFDQQT